MVLGEVSKGEQGQKRGKVVIFTGPEGSGKTTQAKLLADTRKVPYVSFGDLLRDRAANDQSSIGDACRKMFAEHAYLEPRLLTQIVGERLIQEDVRDGMVIEGALRSVQEAEELPKIFERSGIAHEDITVVYLRLPIWKSVERLTKERKRDDDTEDGVLSRLSKHFTQLGERMSLTRKQWNVEQIMVLGKDIPTVQEEINTILTK